MVSPSQAIGGGEARGLQFEQRAEHAVEFLFLGEREPRCHDVENPIELREALLQRSVRAVGEHDAPFAGVEISRFFYDPSFLAER